MGPDLSRILDELTEMRAESRETLVKVTRIEEQVKDVGDHEARLRVIEQILPADLRVRLVSMERWRWMAMGALGTSGLALAGQVFEVLKGAA